MDKLNVIGYSDLINKKINDWTFVSYMQNKSMSNVYIVTKNSKEYIIKLENINSGPLFCELHFYVRITKLIPKDVNILPLIDFGLNITVNNIKQRNIILEKKKYCLENYNFNNLEYFNIFCTKIIKTLEFINSTGYVHGDIKPQNIVFDDIYEPYIVDFGLVCKYANKNYIKKEEYKNGSYIYMSTDAHQGIISQRTDLISFGFVIYEILEKKEINWNHIYTEKNNNKFYKKKMLFIKNNTNPIVSKYFNIVFSKNYNETPSYDKLYKFFS